MAWSCRHRTPAFLFFVVQVCLVPRAFASSSLAISPSTLSLRVPRPVLPRFNTASLQNLKYWSRTTDGRSGSPSPPLVAGLSPPPPHALKGEPMGGSLRSQDPRTSLAGASGEKATEAGSRDDHGSPAEIGRGQGKFTQWRVYFCAETDPGNWIEGRVRFTPHSRWLVFFDLENAILAGDYWPDGDSIEVGRRFKIDGFDVLVDECVQVDLRSKRPELIDLTETRLHGKSGGRFWALIDSDDEDQGEDHSFSRTEVCPQGTEPTETPALIGAPDRRHSKFQKVKPKMKPWIGPIPKVFREPITLSDFLADSWTLVTRKKKKAKQSRSSPPHRSPVARSMSEIRTARRACLNSLLGPETVLDAETIVGSLASGEALLGVQALPDPPRTCVHDAGHCPASEGRRPSLVPLLPLVLDVALRSSLLRELLGAAVPFLSPLMAVLLDVGGSAGAAHRSSCRPWCSTTHTAGSGRGFRFSDASAGNRESD
ncbi:uncharacterized protein [Triticum aestivum]|uniref:uncharacterized protein n=1 Tax=Triticum aestivum TaxID=4565 RepID=UPI001D027496|nr:uncharacterized protein LOC123084164 [Triticum aestivum]